MYRYLFFDADGTLFDFNEAENHAFYQMAQELGFSATSGQLLLYKACNEACWKAFERFEITQETLKTKRFEDFFAAEHLAFDPALASTSYQRFLSRQGILYKQSRPLMDELIQRGYTLYLATNGIAEVQRGRLEVSGTGMYFKDIFISEEMGSQKPDSTFFSLMLERTGLESNRQECLMIGDSLVSDIGGGLLAGLDTLWLNKGGAGVNSTLIRPTYEMGSLPEMLDLLLPLTERSAQP
ncbi:MAG: YjjG family noncanonical pyrimidine nucleotidase [Sphaerochaeta sp.]|nr:YjjG family noncanonical pyrimidine nucleotidase [Sphaerochaeta sp.]